MIVMATHDFVRVPSVKRSAFIFVSDNFTAEGTLQELSLICVLCCDLDNEGVMKRP